MATIDDRELRSLVLNDREHFLRQRFAIERTGDGGREWVATIRLPRARPGAGRSRWEVRAVQADGRQVAVSWGAFESSGHCLLPREFDGLWAERTAVGNLTFSQQPQRVEIERVTADRDGRYLQVAGTFVGRAPVAARLHGAAATTDATELVVADGHLRARFELRAALWGAAPAALPPGRYDLELFDVEPDRAGAAPIALETSSDQLSRMPTPFDTASVNARFERARGGLLFLTVTDGLSPAERGARHQRELRDWHASAALTPRYDAVLFRSYFGENTACNARAVHHELQARGSDLDLFWAVTDHSVEVPAGGIPVVHESRQWYELLGAARYVMDNMHQPIYHVKREHQVVIQTFHGYPFKVMGHAHWAQIGVTKLRLESFDRRAREWDYLVSPARYATPLLRRDFRYDGDVLEIGYPRNDALLADGCPGAS